jgi:hypothetical protein
LCAVWLYLYMSIGVTPTKHADGSHRRNPDGGARRSVNADRCVPTEHANGARRRISPTEHADGARRRRLSTPAEHTNGRGKIYSACSVHCAAFATYATHEGHYSNQYPCPAKIRWHGGY